MRYPSIDILRTVAIFIMVLVHFGENLSGLISPLAGLGAPLFAFLSGLSYRLWLDYKRSVGIDEPRLLKSSVQRGLFLFGVGIAFNILVWLPSDVFNWDVLTFLGSALILLAASRDLPAAVHLVAAGVAVLVSPLLRGVTGYHEYWELGYFDPDPTLSDVLIGYFVTGYFPLFPWIAFSFVGFATGTSVSGQPRPPAGLSTGEATVAQSAGIRPAIPWPVVAAGAVLVGLSAVAHLLRSHLASAFATVYLGGWTMFPPTVEYVLGTLGLTLLLFGFGHGLLDRNPRWPADNWVYRAANTFSRYSLTIYILHHVIHLWPLWIYGHWQGEEPTAFWTKAMPLHVSLLLAIIFLACCYVVLRWLGPRRVYGIEALMRWLCD